jgi:hypothetical protein
LEGILKRLLLIAGMAIVLSGCVDSEVFVMKDPKTGQVARCGSTEHGASFFPIIQTKIDNTSAESCAKGYEAAGWQRMNPP